MDCTSPLQVAIQKGPKEAEAKGEAMIARGGVGSRGCGDDEKNFSAHC